MISIFYSTRHFNSIMLILDTENHFYNNDLGNWQIMGLRQRFSSTQGEFETLCLQWGGGDGASAPVILRDRPWEKQVLHLTHRGSYWPSRGYREPMDPPADLPGPLKCFALRSQPSSGFQPKTRKWVVIVTCRIFKVQGSLQKGPWVSCTPQGLPQLPVTPAKHLFPLVPLRHLY